jgi:hypothetical protein
LTILFCWNSGVRIELRIHEQWLFNVGIPRFIFPPLYCSRYLGTKEPKLEMAILLIYLIVEGSFMYKIFIHVGV